MTKPCSTSTCAPIASRPRRCMSTLRLPMLSPPGSATRASPHRASSGPSTLNDARMSVTSSYGASGRSSPVASTRTSSPGSSSTSAPTARSSSAITSRSRTAGMLRSVVTPGASSAAAICFVPAFFDAPEISTRPWSGPLGAHAERRHDALVAAVGPLLDERGDRLAHVVGPQADGLLLGFDDEPLGDRQRRRRPRPHASRPAPRAAAAPAISRRERLDSFSRSASSTSRSHSPMRYASSASMRAAVQIISLAFPAPTTRGRRCVPPRSGRIPYLCSSRPDLRAAREHADVARERELQAGAERVAAHRRDRRVPRVLEPGVRLLRAQDAATVGSSCVFGPSPRSRRRRRRHPVNTVVSMPGRERAAVADHDERADRRRRRCTRGRASASRATSATVKLLSLSGRFRRSQATSPSRVNSSVSMRRRG